MLRCARRESRRSIALAESLDAFSEEWSDHRSNLARFLAGYLAVPGRWGLRECNLSWAFHLWRP
jgi:hypothetical protein